MEIRKITIVSTKTQKKSVIMSGAETLAELKRDLNEAGIDYNGMTFYEGTSKTELKTDESVLPKDVPYTNRTTGETKNTNELVFMLTNTNKKIKSGAATMSRAEAYAAIKANNLQAACLKNYGKNFTQCSTNDLIILINKESKKAAAPVAEKSKTETPKAPKEVSTKVEAVDTSTTHTGCVDTQARAAITELINILYDADILEHEDRDSILNILDSTASIAPIVSESYRPDSASSYSDNEIDNMFKDML